MYSRPSRGSDRWYYVVTPHEGVLSVMAKGAARSGSKLAGHMQSFDRVRLMVGRGRQDHLAAVSVLESFEDLRREWFNFILGSSLVELLVKISTPAGHKSRQEYDLALEAFRLIASTDSRRQRTWISRIFFWRLMSLAGWRPNSHDCALCHRSLVDGEIFFQTAHGFVCDRHASEGSPLSREFVDRLRLVTGDASIGDIWGRLSGVENDSADRSWLDMSQYYYQHVIKQPLRSLELFKYA